MEGPVLLNKVIKRWPAIIFAVNRTANVPGRIILLIVSIKTIKGIKIFGVPWGIIWANICWELLIHPYNINLNHKGSEIDNDRIKWLVLVKIYGNNPKKLLNKIKENIETKIKVDPLNLFVPSKILNSLWRVFKIKFQIIKNRLGINQKE